MKPFILLLLTTLTLAAQNRVLVNFYPPNKPYPGLTNYPSATRPTDSTELPAGWATNVTLTAYQNYVASLKPAYAAAVAAAEAQVKTNVDANIAQLVSAYSNLQWVADNFQAVTNVANIRVALRATGDVLLKLKPVLTEMYRKEEEK